MEEVQALVRKAEESLDVARVLLDRGNFGFSASRSYYAMFYLAEALLLTQGLSFSKHSAVIAAFGRVFVKTGLMEGKFHAYLRKGFEAVMISGFGLLFTSMIGLVGFVLWDRRTALAPAVRMGRELEERQARLERVLRELARDNPKVAEILRQVGPL